MNKAYRLTRRRDGACVVAHENARGGRRASTTLAVTLLLVADLAGAADIQVTTATTSAQPLSATDTLTVTNIGSITLTNGPNAVTIGNGAGTGTRPLVQNGGVISTTASPGASLTGLSFGSGVTATGDIVNDGTIYGNYSAIGALSTAGRVTFNGGILNNGSLFASQRNQVGAGARAIQLVNTTMTGAIVNHGRIQTGGPDSALVAAAPAVFQPTLAAALAAVAGAPASVQSAYAASIQNWDTYYGIWLNGTTVAGGIQNYGTIYAQGNAAIGFFAGAPGSPTVANGILNAQGAVLASSTAGIRFLTGARVDGDVVNAGSILGFTGPATGTGTVSGAGITMAAATLNGSIRNLATGLIATNNVGILISSSTVNGGLYNAGTIRTFTAQNTITVSGTSVVTGPISNQAGGAITSLQDGIQVATSGASAGVQGGVSNAGTITATRHGLSILSALGTGVTGGLVNTGTITTSAAGGMGILVANTGAAGTGVSGGVVAGGSITAAGANADAISVANTAATSIGVSGDVSIEGTLTATRHGLRVANTNATSIGVQGDVQVQAGATITSGSDAIAILNTAGTGLSGAIVNAATLTAPTHVIRVANGTGTGVGGGIQNTGSLSTSAAGAAGVLVANTGAGSTGVAGGIQSSGSITASGTNADAISVANTGATSTGVSGDIVVSGALAGTRAGLRIANTNAISTGLSGGLTLGAGAAVSGADGVAIVNTAGTGMTGDLTQAGAVTTQGAGLRIANAAGTGVGGALTSTGTIAVSGSSGTGILVANVAGTGVAGALTHTGTITSAGTGIAVTNGAGAIGVGGALVNTGSISAASQGVLVGASGRIGGGIVNDGTIATTTAGTNAVELANTANAFTVTHRGTIQGAMALGINTLDIAGGSARIVGDTTGAAASVVNLQSSFTSEGALSVGTFNVAAGASFTPTGSPTVTVGAGGFNLAGTLALAQTTRAIAGNFAQAASGTISIALANATNGYGRLAVSGNATITDGAALVVTTPANLTIANGTVVPGVVTAGGTLTVNPQALRLLHASPLFTLSASTARDPQALDLVVATRRNAFVAPVSSPAPATVGVAQVLQRQLDGGATERMAPVIATLAALPDAATVTKAVGQLVPVMDGVSARASLDVMQALSRSVTTRLDLDALPAGTLAVNDGFAADRFLWGRVFGIEGTQSQRNGFSGYRARTHGLTIGHDREPVAGLRLGAALQIARSDLDGRDAATGAGIALDTATLAHYGLWSVMPTVNLAWQIAASTGRAESHRTLSAFGSTARGDWNTTAVHGSVALSQRTVLDERTTVSPAFRLEVGRVRSQAYEESGAGALDLVVAAQNMRQTVASAELRGAHKLTDRLTVSPYVSLGVDLTGAPDGTTARLTGGGDAFVTPMLESSRLLTRAGVQMAGELRRNLDLALRYDIERRGSGWTAQSLSARVRWAF